MLFKKSKSIIAGLVFGMCVSTASAEVREIYIGKHNNTISDINSGLYVDYFGGVYNQEPFIVSRHMGDQKALVPTWDVSTYTGFNPNGSAHATTRGMMDGTVAQGPNAVQIENDQFGFMLNSWSFPKKDVVGGGPHYIWSYTWDTKCQMPRPWKIEGSDLTMQARIKMPYMHRWGESVGQISFVLYMMDSFNKKPLVMVVNVHDPRGVYKEVILSDGNPFVSSPLVDGMKYITKSGFSSGHQKGTFSDKFFRFHVTEENLLNAINDLNADNGTAYLSTNPSDYYITSANILMEVFTPDSSHISMGASFKKVMLLSCGNGDCSL